MLVLHLEAHLVVTRLCRSLKLNIDVKVALGWDVLTQGDTLELDLITANLYQGASLGNELNTCVLEGPLLS